jgi:hypothetical protein
MTNLTAQHPRSLLVMMLTVRTSPTGEKLVGPWNLSKSCPTDPILDLTRFFQCKPTEAMEKWRTAITTDPEQFISQYPNAWPISH